MKLTLERVQLDSDVTIGALYVDGNWVAWVCEDAVREVPGKPVKDWKIPGKTAIPYGKYAVQITPSNRFKRPLPLLIGVDGFSGVRIHSGNTAEDTEGCLLPGLDRHAKSVGRSRVIFDQLFADLSRALKLGGVTIDIVKGVTP